MRRSHAFLATSRDAPDTGSEVVALLHRGGLIRDFGSGLYGLLPRGERVRRKVTARIETAMDSVGAQRVSMPALQYSPVWRRSGRWENFENEMFTLENRDGQAMCLAPSHEEASVHLVDGLVRSHADLPLVVNQVGEKYRDDHARNGLVRCKAFTMKDAYSFHLTENELAETYDAMRRAYIRIFEDVGLEVAVVPVDDEVMGGSTSSEFVAPVAEGSERLVHCTADDSRFGLTDECGGFSEFTEGDQCPDCGGRIATSDGIEVGHVFQLGRRYSEALDLTVDTPDGTERHVEMGSYGIGITRLIQTLVQQAELGSDDAGLHWPVTDWGTVAPYRAALVPLDYEGDHGDVADRIYEACDTDDVHLFNDPAQSIGERFAESDLLGIPAKVIVGNHYEQTGEVEVQYADGTVEVVAPAAVPAFVTRFAPGGDESHTSG